MASLPSPLRAWRGILKELKAIQGPTYRRSLAYNFVIGQFRKNEITGQRYCRSHHEALHASNTYLCLLASTRKHMALHNLYHGKGETSVEMAAAVCGLKLPAQPGGKGWEENKKM